MFKGKVCWFNNKKGYGFISWEQEGKQQKDIFLHYSDILVDGFKTVPKDAEVEFEVGQNIKGDPKAINVKIIK